MYKKLKLHQHCNAPIYLSEMEKPFYLSEGDFHLGLSKVTMRKVNGVEF